MHSIFDKLTRTLSGDFMRRDDCCGGNGGEPAVKCCKPNKELLAAQKKTLMSGGFLAVNCKAYGQADIGVRVGPEPLNEREADSLISLLYGDKTAERDAFIAESAITGRAVGVIDGAEFRRLPAGKVFIDGDDK